MNNKNKKAVLPYGENFQRILREIEREFPQKEYALEKLTERFEHLGREHKSEKEKLELLIRSAVELTEEIAPKWEFIGARLLNFQFQEELKIEMKSRKIHNFYEKIQYLTEQGLYGAYILEHYSKEELRQAESMLRPERDKIFNFSGLELLLKRYVIRTGEHIALETPQEMYLGIALHLAMKEKRETEKGPGRMEWVRKFYDMLSLQEVTMATPTLSNARKPYHQLSWTILPRSASLAEAWGCISGK